MGVKPRFVATIPDFWLIDEQSCFYPKKWGKAAALKREVPKDDWDVYTCVVRKEFGK